MASELKGTVINMKSLSQHIDNPIIVGGGDSNGRYLTILFTQEAAAQFAPETQVYLSWRHVQKNIKGYNVFTEIPREDTDELSAKEQPPAWYIYYPKSLLHEGDVIASIDLVDDISVASSTTFTIRVLADPWDGTNWIETDDLNEFKRAIVRAQNLQQEIDDSHALLQETLERLEELHEIVDYGDNDNSDSIEIGDDIEIIEWGVKNGEG